MYSLGLLGERESCPGWQGKGLDRGVCSPFRSLNSASRSVELLGIISNPLKWTQSQVLLSGSSSSSNLASQPVWASTCLSSFPSAVSAGHSPMRSAGGTSRTRGERLGRWLMDWMQFSANHFLFYMKRECGITHKGGCSLPIFWSGFELDNVFILHTIKSICWRLSRNLLKLAYLRFAILSLFKAEVFFNCCQHCLYVWLYQKWTALS